MDLLVNSLSLFLNLLIALFFLFLLVRLIHTLDSSKIVLKTIWDYLCY